MIHESLGIETGMITTVHNITGTQSLVDMANTKKKAHEHFSVPKARST